MHASSTKEFPALIIFYLLYYNPSQKARRVLPRTVETVYQPQVKAGIYPAPIRPSIPRDGAAADECREHPKTLPVAQPNIHKTVHTAAYGAGVYGAGVCRFLRCEVRRRCVWRVATALMAMPPAMRALAGRQWMCWRPLRRSCWKRVKHIHPPHASYRNVSYAQEAYMVKCIMVLSHSGTYFFLRVFINLVLTATAGAVIINIVAYHERRGGIAQLARAHGSYPWCRGFKSLFRY